MSSKMSHFSETVINWLYRQTPCFPVKASSIQIIHEPIIFYQTLLKKCANAQRRITLSSLYLGTGHMEQKIVETLSRRLGESSSNKIKVKVLMDYCRSSRGLPNSRTMLKDLVQKHPSTFQVSLYHTPMLRGTSKAWLPYRYNELLGLQHMKLFIFDDTLIISGANLSNDYFTNRQDRYIMFEDCPDVANFYEELVTQVCEFSLQMKVDSEEKEKLTLDEAWPENCHPYESPEKSFVSKAHENIRKVLDTSLKTFNTSSGINTKDEDTWVFPLIQMGQLHINHDSEILPNLLNMLGPNAVMHIASGYFNVTDTLASNILRSKACYSILVAHPSANGFLSAKGLAGGIPSVYTLLAADFMKEVRKLGRQDQVRVFEFIRPGWTYHAKGLWLSQAGEKLPFLTYVGSSNLGYRSQERDLEAQAIVVTRNEDLQSRLAKERDILFQQGQLFPEPSLPPDRKPTLWIQFCAHFFRSFF